MIKINNPYSGYMILIVSYNRFYFSEFCAGKIKDVENFSFPKITSSILDLQRKNFNEHH